MPGLFSAASVARLRAFAESLMTASCAIDEPVTIVGLGGTPNTQWAPVLSGVPCSLRSDLPVLRTRGDAVVAVRAWRVRLGGVMLAPDAPALTRGMRLTVAGHDMVGVADPLVVYVAGESSHTGALITRAVTATDDRPEGR